MRHNVTIHMGASRFDAHVRNGDDVVTFDLFRMKKPERDKFRVELVKAFRESRLPPRKKAA